MIRNCNNCEKEYEAKTDRSKFCSTKCKLSYHRNNSTVSNDTQTPENDTQRDTERKLAGSTAKLTKTDQLFQDDAIARNLGEYWLSFSEIVREVNCNHCKKKFKTRLPLLRYCSPKCRTAEIKGNHA